MQVISFGNEFERDVAGEKAPVTVFLHGFPALRSKQNIELAEGFAIATGRRVLVPLYDGLSRSPGIFWFSQTLLEVRQLVSSLSNSVLVDLVGHSWGGYMALALAAEASARLRRMVLISPLLNFGTLDVVTGGFTEYSTNPLLTLPPAKELAADFMSLGAHASGEALVSQVDPAIDVLFLQAARDTTTPPDIAQASLKHFVRQPEFELVDNDHSFLANRAALTARIVEFLES
jgi:pimeloyl-ACP methyl ester carboxylesterase